jgi:hypothetical protein
MGTGFEIKAGSDSKPGAADIKTVQAYIEEIKPW